VKAKMLVAEAATLHPDGTMSILRAGITHLWAVAPPFALQGALVVRIDADGADKGPHRFDIRCMNEDGGDVMPSINGQFDVPQGGAGNNLILGFNLAFPNPGTFVFVVRVDDVQRDSWNLLVTQGQPRLPGSKETK
jgi:hypothetical protein